VNKKENGVNKKVLRFLEVQKEIEELENEQLELKTQLFTEMRKKYPDEKYSAAMIFGNHNVKRIVVKTVEWDYDKLKKLIGETAYNTIVKIKESIDKSCEPKIKELIEQGILKKDDIFKVSKPKYSLRLMIGEKSKEEGIVKEETRDFFELMDY
jgi:translation initiation factor IF-2